MTTESNIKKRIAKGVVKSAKMQKTVVVEVVNHMQHPKYKKIVSRSKKYHAHNENLDLKEGDSVLIMETRPLSKMKRWAVVEKVKEGSNIQLRKESKVY
jgi:small subunit ribosomal protein S17